MRTVAARTTSKRRKKGKAKDGGASDAPSPPKTPPADAIDAAASGALKKLLARYAPPGFLIGRDGALLHVLGDADKFIARRPGGSNPKIVDLLAPELALVVANGLGAAANDPQCKFRRSIRRPTGAGETIEVVTLEPLCESAAEAEYLLLTIEEQQAPARHDAAKADDAMVGADDALQVANEEFDPVSGEPQRRIDELARMTHDMERLLTATAIGTIFLDERMRVRRFTSAAALAFNLSAGDVGRPISHITLRFDGVDFVALLAEVNETGVVREREVTVDGHSYLLRILPYRADGADQQGVVVTLIDVAALKAALARWRDLDRRHQAVLDSLSESIMCWDAATETILFCNFVFADVVEERADKIMGRGLRAVMSPALYSCTQRATEDLQHGKLIERTVRYVKKSGGVLFRSVRFTRIDDEHGRPTAYIACGRDVSEHYRYTRALEELSSFAPAADEPIETFSKYAVEIGARLLGTPYGLISEVEGDHHRIVCLVGPQPQGLDVSAAATFLEVADGALCEFVFEGARQVKQCGSEDPVQVLDDARTLRHYIGVQVRASGQVYATLSFFTDTAPEFGAFNELQRGFVLQLAQWLGMRIDAWRQHRALRRSEAKLRLMFDSVPQEIWRIDSARRIQRINTAAAALMGRPAEKIIGDSIDEVMPVLDAHWRDDDALVARTRKPLVGVIQESVGPDGKPRWISTDRIPYVDDSGELSMLIVANDITSLKERESELQNANDELRRSRERFEQLYRHTPAMMCQLSRDGGLREVSDLWQDKTGYDRDEACGRGLGDFLNDESRVLLLETLLPAIWRDGFCGAAPLVLLNKPGRPIEVELSGFLNTLDGTDSYCLAVLVDVTARNEAEKALERANRELANANEGLKKFAHIASHDLQEPLRKISQFTEMLAEEFGDRLGEDGGRLIKIVSDSAARMRRLVRDILTFSKSVNGALSKSELPLADLIGDVVGELEVTVREAGATINIGELPNVMGDRTAVQLMLRNLISNGLKYSKPDAPPVVSFAGALVAEGRYEIRVSDNGCGFDPRYKEIVFDPFTRLNNRSDVDGSGIGLAMCRSVCERHHWTITAESEVGVGSVFTIALPTSDIVDRTKGGSADA